MITFYSKNFNGISSYFKLLVIYDIILYGLLQTYSRKVLRNFSLDEEGRVGRDGGPGRIPPPLYTNDITTSENIQ